MPHPLNKALSFGTNAGILLALIAVTLMATPRSSSANPTFARETGQSCSVCHVPAQEPQLNPTGQSFKACGYRFCNGPPHVAEAPMCHSFRCTLASCRLQILSVDGKLRVLNMVQDEDWKIRHLLSGDRYCFTATGGSCEFKVAPREPC